MRFVIDAQLPPALVRRFYEMGHDAEHVTDCGMQAASDGKIWNHALRTDAAIVTKDEDFAQRRAMVDGRPRNIWIRLLDARWRHCLRFDKPFPAILHALDGGETLIEIV